MDHRPHIVVVEDETTPNLALTIPSRAPTTPNLALTTPKLAPAIPSRPPTTPNLAHFRVFVEWVPGAGTCVQARSPSADKWSVQSDQPRIGTIGTLQYKRYKIGRT
jgi:hypothetical protein